jgi:tetratricopeptide (TPR) repeat protein
MKPLLFSLCLLLSLASIGQTKKPAAKPAAKSVTGVDTKKAERLFNQFFALNQGDTAELRVMSELTLQIIKADPQSKYCTYTTAWANLALKKYSDANELIEPLLRDNPDWAEAYYLKGLYLSHTKDNGYIQQIQRCIELNPTLFQPIFFLASELEKANNFKLSLVYYNKLEQVNPKHKSLYYNRGHVKTELEDYAGGVADYTKVLQDNPSHFRALFNRGHAYMLMKDYPKAEVDFTAFIKIKPDYSWAYYYRGSARYSQNKLEEACVDMKTAVKLGNKSAEEFLPYCK